MASPQVEDGFLRVANELAEALMRTNLSAYQSRILWAVWRRTYGFNKKEDWLSNRQLVDMTGIRKQHVSRTVKELKDRNLVTNSGYKIAFNKDYTQWRELPKQVTVTNSGNKVTSTGYKSNLIRGTQKKTNNKRHISGEILSLSNMLADRILQNNPSHTRLSNGKREETVIRWSDAIDKLHRIDNQPIEDIRTMIEWSQADSFWKKNILSGNNLREKWNRLYLEAIGAKSKDAWMEA